MLGRKAVWPDERLIHKYYSNHTNTVDCFVFGILWRAESVCNVWGIRDQKSEECKWRRIL